MNSFTINDLGLIELDSSVHVNLKEKRCFPSYNASLKRWVK